MPKPEYNEETDQILCDALYFIAEADTSLIKIGRSNNPKSRLKRLQTGNPRRLSFLHVAENQGWQEAFWHRAFSYDHQGGEWFDGKFGLAKAIKLFAKGEDWLDCPRQCPLDDYDPKEWAEHLRDAFDAYSQEVLFGEQTEQWSAYWSIEDPDFDGRCIMTRFLEASPAPAILAEIDQLKDTPNGR